MTKTELTTASGTSLVDNEALSAFDAFSGQGFGNVSADDFNIPRIALLGDLSPQIKKNDSSYIEGAEPGHLADVGVGELYKDGIDFLPVYREKTVIRWRPRKTGEGIAQIYYDGDPIKELGLEKNERGEYIAKDGTGDEFIATWSFYGLNLTSAGRRSFISMKKSNLKIARRWFGQLSEEKLPNGMQAPLFWRQWHVGSFLDSGKGNTWQNFKVEKGSTLPEVKDWQAIFASATDFLKQIEAGQVRGVDSRDESGNHAADDDSKPF